MIGKVCQVSFNIARVKALHRFSNRSMQHLTLACKQLTINGLPCQCVPESKTLVRFLDDKLSGNQIFYQKKQVLLIALHHLLQ